MLVNGAGQVVGVNTAFLSDHANGGSLGLGFAIPAAEATQTLHRLEGCNPQPAGWIGVTLQPVAPKIASALGLSHPTGSIVTAVAKDSPAQQAGLQEGDVLDRLGDAPEATRVEMLRGIAAADIGSTVHLAYRRQGQIAQASVIVAAWPEQRAAQPSKAQTAAMRASATPHGLGFELTDEHGPSGAARVVVRSIDPAIAAVDAGLRQGGRNYAGGDLQQPGFSRSWTSNRKKWRRDAEVKWRIGARRLDFDALAGLGLP